MQICKLEISQIILKPWEIEEYDFDQKVAPYWHISNNILLVSFAYTIW
jgi:hypothetical protein